MNVVIDPTPQPGLPPELAFLTPIDVFAVLPDSHSRTVCSLHGAKATPFCDECDVHFPEQVRARQLPAGAVGVAGLNMADVKRLIDEAVRNAIVQERAFQAWKASDEGKLAASEGPTSQAKQLRADAARKAFNAAVGNTDLDSADPNVRAAAEKAVDAARVELRAAEAELGG